MRTSKLNIKSTLVALLFQFSLQDIISDYEAIITNGINESENFQLPIDNEQYRPKNSQLIEDFCNWDFIVVGAGSAGTVIANRLTEVKKWKVLLIEAGGQETNFSVIPAMHKYLHYSRFNWGYYTTPQKYCCLGMYENRCPIVRGRSLGGSSTINNGFYIRGNKDDYNEWEAEGNSGWAYDEILPYFIKSENSEVDGDPGYHGRGGYWNVKHLRPIYQIFLDYVEGSRIMQNFTSKDPNGRDQLGVFRSQINNRRQFRDSTNNAFLKPIMHRKNLKIIMNAYITKVLIAPGGTKAYGVQFSQDGKQYSAKARMEVILSAGSINTPQILMLSGIGPPDHLKQMNISLISNLPVGKTLYDHGAFYGACISINVSVPDPGDLRHKIRNFFNDYGSLTNPANNLGSSFYRTKYEAIPTYPDLEIAVNLLRSQEVMIYRGMRVTNDTRNAIVDTLRNYGDKFNVILFDLKSQSVGSVTLKSNDPYQFPNIDSNFLAEEYDVEILYEGILTIKKIIKTEPLKKMNATLILIDYPQCRSHKLGSKDYWICAFRLMSLSGNHASGTCRMGPDRQTSVVNNRGVLHGFQNLRIVDASIMPTIIAGHTASPTVMIAERISDFIKLQYGVPIQPITNTIID